MRRIHHMPVGGLLCLGQIGGALFGEVVRTLFLLAGEQVELGTTEAMFGGGGAERTRAYVEGRFG